MRYIVGRNNFALTIFIPVDCQNKCPFCGSKIEYQMNKPSVEKVIDSIKHVASKNIKFVDIVITGGEPFADLSILDKIINAAKENLNYKHLYINTSLPKAHIRETIKYINENDSINGINVSRHLKKVFIEDIADDSCLAQIKKPIKFNCVLYKDPTKEELEQYVDRYFDLGVISFRADYTKITLHNLKTFDDPTFIKLDNLYGMRWSGGCHVCNTDTFGKEERITYHRGTEHSHLDFAYMKEVNDLIIKQNGTVRYDWDPECFAEDDCLEDLALTSFN